MSLTSVIVPFLPQSTTMLVSRIDGAGGEVLGDGDVDSNASALIKEDGWADDEE